VAKLEHCRITLEEKLETLKQFDKEIQVEEREFDNEIKQSDVFKGKNSFDNY